MIVLENDQEKKKPFFWKYYLDNKKKKKKKSCMIEILWYFCYHDFYLKLTCNWYSQYL